MKTAQDLRLIVAGVIAFGMALSYNKDNSY